MKKSVVIDASVALSWVFPSQSSPEADAILSDIEAGTKVIVPSIWFAETANALLVLERRKKITREERTKAITRLGALSIACDEQGYALVFSRVSQLAADYGLSVYDASYLELAARRGLPLASRDTALQNAAKKSGTKQL